MTKIRIFKNKSFTKFARKEGIGDSKLVEAVKAIEAGSIDADLGGGVIKQRIGRAGDGKSGGYRTIIVYRVGDRAFFVFGFAKSDRANVDAQDVRNFKQYAKVLLELGDEQIAVALKIGEFVEVKNG